MAAGRGGGGGDWQRVGGGGGQDMHTSLSSIRGVRYRGSAGGVCVFESGGREVQ